MTPQQQKKSELEAMLAGLSKKPAAQPVAPPRYQAPQRPPNRRDEDGNLRVPAGWE